MLDLLKYIAILVLPLGYFVLSSHFPSVRLGALIRQSPQRPEHTPAEREPKKQLKTVMQPPRTDIVPPKDDPFTTEQLREYNGTDPSKPIYVAIKGTVFDVTNKADVYGAGKSYNIFAGKDGSRGLGRSSLKLEDAVADYSVLDEKELKVLDDWHSFFTKRYNVVGKVVD